jgi:hypothetical protein
MLDQMLAAAASIMGEPRAIAALGDLSRAYAG